MARALSVSEGNGSVSWPANQSKDGTFCLGNCAACLSGSEKSRHFRHAACWRFRPAAAGPGLVTDIFGLVAMILERSGLVDIGIGGGALLLLLLLAPSERSGLGAIAGSSSDRTFTGGIVVGGRRLAYPGGGTVSELGVRSGSEGRDGRDGAFVELLREVVFGGKAGVLGGGVTSVVVI